MRIVVGKTCTVVVSLVQSLAHITAKGIPAHLKDGLFDSAAIRKEIEAFKAKVQV